MELRGIHLLLTSVHTIVSHTGGDPGVIGKKVVLFPQDGMDWVPVSFIG